MKMYSSNALAKAEIGVEGGGNVASVTICYPDGIREIFLSGKTDSKATMLTAEKFKEAAKIICRGNPYVFQQLYSEIREENYKALLKEVYDEILNDLRNSQI